MKQTTLFGKEIALEYMPKDKGNKGNGRKTPTMQQLYGTIEGKTCKTCKHCEKHGFGHTNAWYKCEIWNKMFTGSSSASDIRLKWTACKKYEEAANNG